MLGWLKERLGLGGPTRLTHPTGPEYDVAISYASEETDLADTIASRLRQDGYRFFYNPNRLHKLLGLEITPSLQAIYANPRTQVVALVSTAYMSKSYPQEEFRAALRGGPGRIIPIRIGLADLPEQLRDVSYADTTRFSPEQIAIHVAQALEQRIGQPTEVSLAGSPVDLAVPSVVPLDNPSRPYTLNDVEFFDGGEKYFVNVLSDIFEFDEPIHYLNRGIGSITRENVFRAISKEMVLQAKSDVRALLKVKETSGWQIFNGRKFGVAQLRRTRSAENEHHRLLVNVYETDYYTSLFSKKLYALLSPERQLKVDQGSSLQEYSGLLTSFGLDILLFAPRNGIPHLLLTKRSGNVANSALSGSLWHVSMNEGLSSSDRYAAEFDASSTLYRGFH